MAIGKKDPLTGEDFEVTDLSTAWHALNAARKIHVAIENLGKTNSRDFGRMQKESWQRQQGLGGNASDYISSQLNLEASRLSAELGRRTSRLNKRLDTLKKKVAKWFKSEVENGASWLGGGTSAKLSGCIVYYGGGGVAFRFIKDEDEENG